MIEITPAKKIKGRVASTLMAAGDSFVTAPVDALKLTYEGIVGDIHAGITRNSGAREPWYKRGTEMRNERMLSILSVEELAEISSLMGIGDVKPEWIGANLVLEGIPNMSYLPSRTLLMFDNGTTLRIDGYNVPCRLAGGSIASYAGLVEEGQNPRDTETALAFTKAGHMKRGLVAWVECEGEIRPGDTFTARIWEQWVYP